MQRRSIFLENYTKVVLYAYPFLRTVDKDYAAHIRNRALLSYVSAMRTEDLAEYLAAEILKKEKLEWLKEVMNHVLSRLSREERTLVAIRYFGKRRKDREKRSAEKETEKKRGKSERMYFRRQLRLGNKIGGLLKLEGLTQEIYEKEFQEEEIFSEIHAYIEEGRDPRISTIEREWLRG